MSNTREDIEKALGRDNKTFDTNTGDTTTDYYNALRNESYKTLLNSEVQASIARDQALKYTNNSLRAKGYANQGMAESTGLGLQSQYQTALANAANTYQQSMDGINTQQRAEVAQNQKDNFESMTTLMSNATDKTQLDNVLTSYGIGVNTDGTLDYSKSNLDSESQKQLNVLYSMYGSQFNSGLNSLDALNSKTYTRTAGDRKGVVSTLGEYFGEEIKALWHKGSNGEYQNGDVIKLTNSHGEEIYMQWDNNNFKVVNESAYNSANNRHNITWTKGLGISYK